jgi:hypothetical protein
MKEITDCIRDTGCANSSIFCTLNLTSGFWQMQLDEESQHFLIHYKKGTNMPTDYLSRLPSLPVSAIKKPTIAAFDPFTPELQLLQR